MNGFVAVVQVEYVEINAIGVAQGIPCSAVGVAVGGENFLPPAVVDHNLTSRIVVDAIDKEHIICAVTVGGEHVGDGDGAVLDNDLHICVAATPYINGVDCRYPPVYL
jgi:hypothetical protein